MTEQTTETPVDAPDSPEQSDSEGLSPTPEGEGTGEAPKGNREAKYRTGAIVDTCGSRSFMRPPR